MTSFLYFAYGSNLLAARLRERCPSAQFEELAYGYGYELNFLKLGRDGSGKATLVASSDKKHYVPGVLYRIDLKERSDLDRAEAHYDRYDQFVVSCAVGERREVTTFIAPKEACRAGLKPFDWYLALIQAGASENGFDNNYLAALSSSASMTDPDSERAASMFLMAGKQSGRGVKKRLPK